MEESYLERVGAEKLKELEGQFNKHLNLKKNKLSNKHLNLKKNKLSSRKSSKRAFKKNVEDSPDTMTKKDFETLERGIQKLKEYETELNSLDTTGFSVETASIKSKLKDVSQIPHIEKEMRMLRLKIKEKEGGAQKRSENIDYDVDVLVDTDFNNFLSGVKTTVAQKMKNREREIEELLHHDLLKREKKYREKHLSLMDEFNEKKKKLEKEYADKYKLDVKIRLKKEVEDKFDNLLKQKFASEKARLTREYTNKIREEEKKKLENERGRIEKLREEERNKLKKEREELEKEKEKIKELKNNLRKEVEEKYKKKIAEHEEEMKKKLSQVLGAG